jgi:predicted Zn-dependent peptidase
MYKKLNLNNGVRIVSEKIPYVRSVSFGIWVGTGSRNETSTNNGISHFIEHMLFKGTNRRNAKEIAESIDNIGGQLNAFTGKECTCYYVKTLDEHIDIAVDVLADMLFNSRLQEKDIALERKVIQEEINMYEDSPEEIVHDLMSSTVWGGNSLGYPILGSPKSLNGISREMMQDYMGTNYIPSNCVISVAGNFDDEKLIDLVSKHFKNWNTGTKHLKEHEQAIFISDSKVREKDTEQVHMCLGFKGIEHGNDEIYSLLAINNIFGGGMSSRLFQKIREEQGLVYSIYSFPSSYKNAGVFTVYAGMNPEELQEVARLVIEEIRILKNKGLTRDELNKSKEQLKGNFILGLESTSSRMNSIGKSELLTGYINTPDEVLDKIEKISMESVHDVIQKVLNFDNMSFSAVGNIKKSIDIKELY